jgi:hypothetical protein
MRLEAEESMESHRSLVKLAWIILKSELLSETLASSGLCTKGGGPRNNFGDRAITSGN